MKQKREMKVEFMPSTMKPCPGGIYKLWFGSKHYYIGRSRCLKLRKSGHQNYMNKRLNGLIPPEKIDLELDYYQKIMALLQRKKSLKTVKMEVLIYCKTDRELVKNEQKWLTQSANDKYCLNVGFEAKPYKEKGPDYSKHTVELRPWLVKKNKKKKQQQIKEKKKIIEQKQKEAKERKYEPASEVLKRIRASLDELESKYNLNRK